MGNTGSGPSLDAMVLRRQSLVSQRMFRALGRCASRDRTVAGDLRSDAAPSFPRPEQGRWTM